MSTGCPAEDPVDSLPPIVLLVEDDPDTLRTHSRYLESAGLWVATATSATDAFPQVHELLPNLLVTDLTFGGETSGAGLVHAVKGNERTRCTPLVILSSVALEAFPADMRRHAEEVLVKPVPPALLYRRARAVIQASAALRVRCLASLKCAESLVRDNLVARAKGRAVVEQLHRRNRACPKCGSHLEWLERGVIGSVEYDYYRWCFSGCGLYCFDIRASEWIELAS